MHKQNDLPFLSRYLKRDDIIRQIDGCDTGLNESVGLFSVGIFVLDVEHDRFPPFPVVSYRFKYAFSSKSNAPNCVVRQRQKDHSDQWLKACHMGAHGY